jgi:putative hydrolase of the HAD superfamily
VGSAKPDGAIFAAALALAGAAPEEAWHVGDTPEADVDGALAAGLRPVLIARRDVAGGPGSRGRGAEPVSRDGLLVVETLAELIPLAVPA